MAHDRLDGTVDDAQHGGLLEWEQVRADGREQRDGVEQDGTGHGFLITSGYR